MTELFQLLQTSPLAFTIMCGILGLMVGSFLNVVIHRLPKMMELAWAQQCAELRADEPIAAPAYNLTSPRSACPHCNHAISAWENIPIVSYLLLGGKCKGCGVRISPRYPIIEAISGILCAFAAWHFGFGPSAMGALLLIWALLALTAIDFDTQLLPDDITLPITLDWVAVQPVRHLYQLIQRRGGRGSGLPRSLERVLAIQTHHG
jgi:leader peptidase (prepilin peptidase)/N-methyltransferase